MVRSVTGSGVTDFFFGGGRGQKGGGRGRHRIEGCTFKSQMVGGPWCEWGGGGGGMVTGCVEIQTNLNWIGYLV